MCMLHIGYLVLLRNWILVIFTSYTGDSLVLKIPATGSQKIQSQPCHHPATIAHTWNRLVR